MTGFLTEREEVFARWLASRFDRELASGVTNDVKLLNAVIAQAAGIATIDKDGFPQKVTDAEEKFCKRVAAAANSQDYTRSELAVALLALAITRVKVAAGYVPPGEVPHA